jgi:hypothetical protein
MAYPQGEPHVTDSTLLNLTNSLSTGRGEDKLLVALTSAY